MKKFIIELLTSLSERYLNMWRNEEIVGMILENDRLGKNQSRITFLNGYVKDLETNQSLLRHDNAALIDENRALKERIECMEKYCFVSLCNQEEINTVD